jgi:hypothetical protein
VGGTVDDAKHLEAFLAPDSMLVTCIGKLRASIYSGLIGKTLNFVNCNRSSAACRPTESGKLKRNSNHELRTTNYAFKTANIRICDELRTYQWGKTLEINAICDMRLSLVGCSCEQYYQMNFTQ